MVRHEENPRFGEDPERRSEYGRGSERPDYGVESGRERAPYGSTYGESRPTTPGGTGMGGITGTPGPGTTAGASTGGVPGAHAYGTGGGPYAGAGEPAFTERETRREHVEYAATATMPRTRARRERDEESVLSLVAGMASDLGTLVRQEALLLRVELAEKAEDVKRGVASIATGGLVAYAGFLFLLLAAVLGLAEAVEPWLSALIVGGVVCLIGLAMLAGGREKLKASNMMPERSKRSLQKDVGLAKEEIRETRETRRNT